MRHVRQWIGVAVVLAVCLGVQSAYAAKPLKALKGQVVFYNPRIVIFESEFIKVGGRELKTRFGSREQALIDQIKTLKADMKAFQEKGKTMPAVKRVKEEETLKQRDVALQKKRNALIQESNAFKKFLDVEMTKMLQESCRELHNETGCTAVLDTGRTSVIFLAPEADVTKTLRKKIDAKWARKAGKFTFPK